MVTLSKEQHLDMFLKMQRIRDVDMKFNKLVRRGFVQGMTHFSVGEEAASVGAALTQQYEGTDNIVIAFSGDSATNEGSFHESVNLAAVWNLPVIFFIINNRYGISTDITYSTKIPHLYMRADAYGIPGHYVEDGNDLMAVYEKMHEVINYVRSGNGPAIVEVESYRWFGHSTADAGVYRTKEEVDSWKAKDPVKRYRAYLIENEIATEEELAAIEAQVIKEVEEGVKFAEESPFPDMSVAFEDVFVD